MTADEYGLASLVKEGSSVHLLLDIQTSLFRTPGCSLGFFFCPGKCIKILEFRTSDVIGDIRSMPSFLYNGVKFAVFILKKILSLYWLILAHTGKIGR